MASVSELLSIYETTESLTEAKGALDQIAAMERPAELELGECYDSLAGVAGEWDEFELAAQAQRLAIEHGCRLPDLAQEMLGWYLLNAGRREEGEAVFAAACAERGEDPELHARIGAARADSGDYEGAVRAFEEALRLAESRADAALARRLRAERRECREELGLPPDDIDHLAIETAAGRVAGISTPALPEADSYAVAWFPRGQIGAALARWPSLAEDLTDPDAYCGIIEARLREVRAATGRVPSVAPLQVEALVEFAAEQDLDPDSGAARSRFAGLLASRGEALAWPPGRNVPCWCGSERKYKRCCG